MLLHQRLRDSILTDEAEKSDYDVPFILCCGSRSLWRREVCEAIQLIRLLPEERVRA